MTKDEARSRLLRILREAEPSPEAPAWNSPTIRTQWASLVEVMQPERETATERRDRDLPGAVSNASAWTASDQLSQLTRQVIESIPTTRQDEAQYVKETARATLANTINAIQQGGVLTASTFGKAFSGLGTGLSMSPVVRGLLKLFGAGSSESPPPVNMYSPPLSILVEGGAGLAPGTVDAVSYGQDGLPRRIGTTPAPSSATAPPAITIQVQAIDSRSFMDHSDSIARAVREAMLNNHSLNTVVEDL